MRGRYVARDVLLLDVGRAGANPEGAASKSVVPHKAQPRSCSPLFFSCSYLANQLKGYGVQKYRHGTPPKAGGTDHVSFDNRPFRIYSTGEVLSRVFPSGIHLVEPRQLRTRHISDTAVCHENEPVRNVQKCAGISRSVPRQLHSDTVTSVKCQCEVNSYG